MDAAASFLCSKVTPFTSSRPQIPHFISLRHFHKHLHCNHSPIKNSNNSRLFTTPSPCSSPLISNSRYPSLPFSNSRITPPLRSLKCPYSISDSNSNSNSNSPNPFLKTLTNFSLESFKSSISQQTPIDISKWCLILCVSIAASKWSFNLIVSPFFWMYFSWTWLFWPWMLSIAVAMYGLYSLSKHLKGESTLPQQLAIMTSSFTWLTLVPPAHFNGFLEGWPFVFFFIYHYFFFLNATVRKRLYGDYNPRDHDPKWDIKSPNWQKTLFCISVMIAHWCAAFEGTELHLIPGGWNNVGIWGLVLLAVFVQYNSTLYLAKYSEKVVVPTDVVQFGPYRFVRHPIYASTMLLFVAYFAALRAPVSALFVIVVCLMYYGQKAKMEEAVMVGEFGERYHEYASKVRYKLIPFVY